MQRKLTKIENGVRYFNTGDYVDLSNLRTYYKGIKWDNNIGEIVKVKYLDCAFDLKILKHEKEMLTVLCSFDNKEYFIKTNSLLSCCFGKIVGYRQKFVFNIGEKIKYLKIIDRKIIDNKKFYVVLDERKEKIYNKLEENLKALKKRKVCKRKKTNKNPISKTHPELIKYFVNKEDAENYTFGSREKVKIKCPNCGYEKEIDIYTFVTYGLRCNKCSDFYSFPNKIMTSFLDYLNIEFKNEKKFYWSNNKIYDFYIENIKGNSLIIECHGGQHFSEKGFNLIGGRTLEEEQENDKIKRELALNNGIKHYIELDCRKSEMEWIKNSIMNSELPRLLDFKEDDIDWIKIEKQCLKSYVVKACELWNSGIHDTKKIANKIHRSPASVCTYLKRGALLNICDYTKEKSLRKDDKAKDVYVYDLNLNFINKFPSCRILQEKSEELFGTKLISQCIIRVCLGQRKQYKGYIFSYSPIKNIQ